MTSTEHFAVGEKERTMQLVIREILPQGTGYGNPGVSISYEKQLKSGELTTEIAEKSKEIIRSGECLKQVTDEDDGCIDGRPTEEVMFIDEDGNFYAKHVSPELALEDVHIRQKVAGGGVVTGYAMQRGMGLQGESIDADFAATGAALNDAKIACGAHTGEHAHGDATDCGANDKVRTILENGVKFRSEIGGQVEALLGIAGVPFDEKTYNRVIDRWSSSLTDEAYFEGSTGKSRFDKIEDTIADAQQRSADAAKPVAVTKNLGGDHKEDFIVVNYVEGHSFSQAHFAARLAEEFPEVNPAHRAQAFVVDVPRIVTLAQALSGDDEVKFAEALYAGVAYQLATAATLTDGTLPVLTIERAA